MRAIIVPLILIILANISFAADIDLENMFSDKTAISKINWQKIISSKIFNGKPTKTETFDDSPIVNNYFGDLSLKGIKLDIAMGKKDNIELEYISLYSDNKPSTITALRTALFDIYGDDYVLKISKMRIDEKNIMTFYTYQWTIGTTRVELFIMGRSNPDTISEVLYYGGISYAPLSKKKKLNPVVYITCNSTMVREDGTERKLPELILGIDEDKQKVLTIDYFDSVYKIEGNFLVGEKIDEQNKAIIKTLIDRTSGRLSGDAQIENSHYTISGNCSKQTKERLF